VPDSRAVRSLARGAFVAVALFALLAHGARAASDPVTLVDPFIGTGGLATFGDQNEGQTADFPGAAAPFGMMNWSPDTPTQPTSSGYWYHDTAITGFSMTHVAGAGCPLYGDFDVLPTVGAVKDPAHAQQPFTHIGEIASPGYYAVTLGAAPIRAELAATPRTGLGSFTFPATAQANILVNVASNQAGVTDSQFQIVSPTEIAGSASSGGFCGMPNTFTVYLAAQFDRPFVAHGTWQGATVTAGSNAARGTHAGGYLTFDTTRDRTVKMRVAISYVSIDGARANLAAEGTSWDVAGVRRTTAAAWRSLLSEVNVNGNTLQERRMFYTALYHVLLDPNLFSDVDGRYTGFDGNVHQDPTGHAEYANFSGWDTYRTTMALQALLVPSQTSDMIESLVHTAQQGGWLPKWPAANGYTGVMGGDAADPLIASAYAFGARGFDTSAALAAMIKGANDTTSAPGQGWYLERPDLGEYLSQGYVTNGHTNSVSNEPNGASETLEYALDDFAIARFALATGNASIYRQYVRRAANWEHLFNTATGLIAPRGRDGAFEQQPLTSNGQSGFQEGDAWQYTWMVPQSYGVLVQALGGRAATVAKLDAYLSSLNEGQTLPFAWMGNQPSFGDDWVYLWAGAPYREQLITRELLTALYTPAPDGIPGNDDLGSMSAMWVWEAMGMYPVDVSVRDLELGAPLFTRISIRPPQGPHVEISAPQAADDVPYVTSLRVNGTATQKTWLALPRAGTLRLAYTLSRTPDVHWGSAPQDAPPTYVAARDFPPASSAALQMPSLNVTLAPGGSASLPFALANSDGRSAVAASWNAVVPPALALQPARGSLRAPAYGSAAGHVVVTASTQATPGLYDVALAGITANGAQLGHVYAAVRVAAPADRPGFVYTADSNGNTVTPIDPRTFAFGDPIAVGANPVGVAVSPDGARVYSVNQNDDSVSVIDTATMSVVRTITVGNAPAAVAVSPDGSSIWVANSGANTVIAINAKSHAKTPIAVGSGPAAIVFSPDGATAYAVDRGSDDVTPIDVRTRTARPAIALDQQPFAAAIAPDGKTLYVLSMLAGTVSVVDLSQGRVRFSFAVGKRPRAIAVSPDGSTLWVADSPAGQVTPIDITTRHGQFQSLAVSSAIRVGTNPRAILFAPDGKTALVALSGDNAVVFVDVARRKIVQRVSAGNLPAALAR
jgi:predicted alpha-1,2-mannosidase